MTSELIGEKEIHHHMMHEAVLRSDRYHAHVIGALAHADVLFSPVIVYNVLISKRLPHFSWPIWCDIIHSNIQPLPGEGARK